MSDATFADGAPGPAPLALRAEGPDDLRIMSALVQDAVVRIGDMAPQGRTRQLALALNRFRWEDRQQPQRVRALLVVSDVTGVQSAGIDRTRPDDVLDLLALRWIAGADGAGAVELVFAGGGTIRAQVECLSVDLRDVSQPWPSPSGRVPRHA